MVISKVIDRGHHVAGALRRRAVVLLPARVKRSPRLRTALKTARARVTAIDLRSVVANPLFDADWYRATYPDVASGRFGAYRHWRRHGVREGRKPNAFFDTAWYLDHNPDVERSGLNPLDHYLRNGASEGRNPSRGFDTTWYLRQNPQLAASGMNPLLHFLREERRDGRARTDVDGNRLPTTLESAALGAALAFMSEAGAPSAVTALVIHLGRGNTLDQAAAAIGTAGTAQLFLALEPAAEPELATRLRVTWPAADIRRQATTSGNIGHLLSLLRDGSLATCDLVFAVDLLSPGSREIVADAMHQLALDPAIGLLVAPSAGSAATDVDAAVLDAMAELRADLGIGPDADPSAQERAADGSFWFRPDALAPLAGLPRVTSTTGGGGDDDGTSAGSEAWCAAVRQLIPAIVRSQGFTTATPMGATDRARNGTRIGQRNVKLVAFYLPQFHPIPENDAWWGAGFTEWSQVVRAKPLYEGHRQPRLPRDLGFYDLRLPEARAAQAALAMRYDVNAFCYYYYWFNGRRLLERPLQEVVASGNPDFPFCICWANENWTRRWDGLDKEILVQQAYSLDSNRQFIRDVIPMLRDPRYLRYDGKPVLLVYRPTAIPDLEETLALWRRECRSASVGEVHLVGVRFWDATDVHKWGFDAAVDFPPHQIKVRDVSDTLVGLTPDFDGLIYDYGYAVRKNLESHRQKADKLTHRGLMLAWDNTPRRGSSAHLAHGATPDLYREWLRGVLAQEMTYNQEPESLVFINAWNEWGEGSNLEPDSQFEHGFLEATHGALLDVTGQWNRPAGEPTRVAR